MSKKMSSYKMRVIENNELRVKNKQLTNKIEELERAIDILNRCINNMKVITSEMCVISNSVDNQLVKEFENLFEEIEKD